MHLSDPVIFCPNHSSYFDCIVLFPSFKQTPRVMTAYEELKGLCGLRTLVLTRAGAFPVDRKAGKTVIDPAKKVLRGGENLLIFPEGTIYNNGKLGAFKLGPAIIASAAQKALPESKRVGIVPVHICYGKRNEATGETYNFLKMGFTWRGGVKICFGEPIWMNECEQQSVEEIMTKVREGILHFKSPTSGE